MLIKEMESFVVIQNSDEYKSLLWKFFNHNAKKPFWEGVNKLRTLFSLTASALFLFAYFRNHEIHNLILSCFFFLGILFLIIGYILNRKQFVEIIKDLSNTNTCTVTLNEQTITFQTNGSLSTLDWEVFSEFEEYNEDIFLNFKERFQEPIFLPLSLLKERKKIQNLIFKKVKKKE